MKGLAEDLVTADLAPRFRIGSVSKTTGVSTHALRVWERRYELVKPARSAAGDRLYSEADVSRLRLVKQLLNYGHAVGDVARLSDPDLLELLESHRTSAGPSNGGFRDRYLDAVAGLDVARAEEVLIGAAHAHSPRELIERVVAPILETVGHRWEQGQLCIAQEHAASAIVRNQLGGLLRAFARDPGGRVFVVGTLAGELHELGALMASIYVAANRHRVVYLGPNLPADQIAHAARISGAHAVLLSLIALPEGAARPQLAELSRQLPPHTELIVGGRAAKLIEPPPPGVQVVRSLAALDVRLQA